MRAVIPAIVLVGLLAGSARGQLPTPTRVSSAAAATSRLQQGRALLDARRFAEARDAFAAVLDADVELDAGSRAVAHFGRGVAVQELLRDAEVSDSGVVAAALADYDQARQLDSAAYFAAAGYNAALLHRAMGRHDRAAATFVAVSAAEPPARRARTLLRAARELEAAGTPGAGDSARALYRRALAADSSLDDARLALAGQPTGVAPAWSLASLTALLRDSSRAPAVAEATLAALHARPAFPPPVADSLLQLLATANVVASLSSETFAATQRDRLRDVPSLHPTLRDGVTAMLAAYASTPVTPEARWWQSGSWDRRRAWSGVLRTIGEWHERDGREALAATYYERALGFPDEEVGPWVDLNAVLPLVLIYDRRARTSPEAAQRLDRLMRSVFEGKAIAYQREDIPRIRQFHIALGSYYAGRRQWVGTPRGAIFQLERMREMTRRMGGAAQGVWDPPLLLEQLMEGYLATNRADDARRLLPALTEANRHAGRADTTARWRARIDRPASG
ncbi:hypothetical protein [Roseisolibacter agri]|uniref:Tetratricopeptide repeat protein n=1 Tax=Roseisolibacter agri TaxID=2014610 RepID=A0AA37QL67_9BACT|nr:hypothetical protein [Roseisolibacter agri]GLC27833.1 hypothetical protein rosag_43460 [Roseisolibacter agri]